MATQKWDAIILGAGPAGLALAARLAPKKVLLLERQPQAATGIRIGESLPGGASVLLQRLGLWAEFQAGNHLERGATLSIWDTEQPVWRDSLRDPAGPGWIIDRRQFEQMLLNAALDRGAHIHYGCEDFQLTRRSDAGNDDDWLLHIAADQITHRSPVIVDASGRSARLARRLGLTHTRQDSQVCLHSFLTSPPHDEDTTTRLLADRNGWWYCVRVPNGQRVLAYHTYAKHPERLRLQHPEVLLEQAQQHPLLAEVLHRTQPADVHCRAAGTAMLDINNLHTAGPGFLAIGDAAITFDPISSQGLFHALASAESAATAITTNCGHNTNALNKFQHELHAISTHYRNKLQLTYQGPKRFANETFWRERRE